MMRFITSRWIAVGLASTVCSVVTTGISRRDNSSIILPPASPPKIPYSCCRETTSNPAAVQELGGLNIIVDRFVVNLEAHSRGIVIGAVGLRHGDDTGLQIRSGGRDCSMKIMGECRYAATARKMSSR